ncbi:MAG TPA: GlsB/YeaQ/YmgE family stress response membrane protein, partial [Dehalococcoidia bacterium]
ALAALITIGNIIGFILMLVVAGIIGWIADRIVPGELPWGWVGAILAGLVGSWVGTLILGDLGPEIFDIAVIPALVGAVILAAIVEVIGKLSTGTVRTRT